MKKKILFIGGYPSGCRDPQDEEKIVFGMPPRLELLKE